MTFWDTWDFLYHLGVVNVSGNKIKSRKEVGVQAYSQISETNFAPTPDYSKAA